MASPIATGEVFQRYKEVELYREILSAAENSSGSLPHVVLIHGAGGSGKTTLLKEFQKLATSSNLCSILMDWQMLSEKYPEIEVGPRDFAVESILECIYRALIESDACQSLQEQQSEYKKQKDKGQNIRHKLKRKLGEYNNENRKNYSSLKSLGIEGIIELWRDLKSNPLQKEERETLDWILSFVDDNLDRGDKSFLKEEPYHRLASALGQDIATASIERPISFAFDTYEVIDWCDEIIRYVIRQSGSRTTWIVAGRSDLSSGGIRNRHIKDALSYVLSVEDDPDVVAVSFRSLGNYPDAIQLSNIIRVIEDDDQDRFVREVLVRLVARLSERESLLKEILEDSIDPLLDLMINCPISDLRGATRKTVDSIYGNAIGTANLSKHHYNALVKIRRALTRMSVPLPESDIDNIETGVEKVESEARVSDDIDKLSAWIDLKSKHEDSGVRSAAVERLGHLLSLSSYSKLSQTRGILGLLFQTLKYDQSKHKESEDSNVRMAAVKALTRISKNAVVGNGLALECVDVLYQSYRKDVNSDIRNLALNDGLAQLSEDSRIEKIRQQARQYQLRINGIPLHKLPENVPPKIALKILLSYEEDIDRRISSAIHLSECGEYEIAELRDVDSLISNLLFEGVDADGVMREKYADLWRAVARMMSKMKGHKQIESLTQKLGELEGYGDWLARRAIVLALGMLSPELDRQNAIRTVGILVNLWRNDFIRDVREAVETALQVVYLKIKSPEARTALQRYPNYDDTQSQPSRYLGMSTGDFYESLFSVKKSDQASLEIELLTYVSSKF